MIDDSREKCSENNYYNCVHPLPYLNPHTRNDSDDCVENSIYGAQSRDISSEDIVANGEAESVEIPDNELEPAGRLWSYLTSISSSFKDGEPSVKFGSDIRNDDEELSGMNNIAEDLSDGCEIRKDNKSLSVVSLAALVKAKGQYICRVA